MKSRFLAVLLFLTMTPAMAEPLVRQSYNMFFPAEMRDVAQPYERFPVFWWNFLIVRTPPELGDQKRAQICKTLGSKLRDYVSASGCRENLRANYKNVVEDWIRDQALRGSPPEREAWIKAIRGAQAQASLPGISEFIWLLRSDPFGSTMDLRQRVEKGLTSVETALRSAEDRERGWVIPIQMSFAPSHTDKTRQFVQHLKEECTDCEGWHFLGPHMSVYENESQIKQDLDVVNLVGAGLLVLLIGALIVLRRAQLLYVVLPLVASIGAGAFVTIVVYGSIHSLTLAFGTGLVGLAIDYAFHSAFWRHSWRANFFGLLTTLAVFLSVGISEVPLLRQMMFFGAVGLTFAFVILYFIFRYREAWFAVEPFSLEHKVTPFKFAIALLCCSGGFYGVFMQKPDFDLRRFDYRSEKTREFQPWMRDLFAQRRPALEVLPADERFEQEIERRTQFAKLNGIEVESIQKYVPSKEVREANLTKWQKQFCPEFNWNLPPDLERFARPALEIHSCANIERAAHIENASYIRHLNSRSQWAHLWFPSDKSQLELIQKHFPKTVSVEEIGKVFSRTLSRDLFLILPLALVGIFLFLWIEFRSIRLVLLAAVPLFAGVGSVFWFFAIVGWPVTFMSLIGLTMICGFSIDYGIFVADALQEVRLRDAAGLWSGLFVCAICNMGGFLPMVFSSHPVMQHLGFSLLIGSIGTYVGTIWGTAGLIKYTSWFGVGDEVV